MRISLPLFAFILPLCGCSIAWERAEIASVQTADFSGVRKVIIESDCGRVAVFCRGAGDEAVIRSTRSARGTTREDARANTETIRVDIARDAVQPDVLRIAAVFPEELRRMSAWVNFEVAMPPRADLRVKTHNGTIQAEGVRGDVDLRTGNGEIRVSDAQGDMKLKTSNGAIRLDGIAGILSAETSNGKIEALNIEGEPVLETSNGSITLELTRTPPNPRVKTVTSNGDISINVPADVSARIALRTRNGSIKREFGDSDVSGLESSRHELSASLNGGRGEIRGETSNGTIRIQAR